MRSRKAVVQMATKWLGRNERDGSYRLIIDSYNNYNGQLPRGIKMQYGWAWCACTWSAIAILLGYTDVMPIEISCGELIKKAKAMGCWVENDAYVPSQGDAILYDWQDDGKGDNTGWPDHVGIVEYVNAAEGYMTVIEGNYDNAVKKRTISINGKTIRGFITPKYTDNEVVTVVSTAKDIKTVAKEVISGLWGSGEARKKNLQNAGFDYAKVQAEVNRVLNGSAVDLGNPPVPTTSSIKSVESTCNARNKDENLSGDYEATANVYCRNDAGTNKKALCLIPKGYIARCDGSYTDFNGTKWLKITITVSKVQYTGFTSSKYLSRR